MNKIIIPLCGWVTLLYSRKLTEHYKPTVMGKNENNSKKFNQITLLTKK